MELQLIFGSGREKIAAYLCWNSQIITDDYDQLFSCSVHKNGETERGPSESEMKHTKS